MISMSAKIKNTDLRRALLFYLIGLCSYLTFLSLGIANFAAGFAADTPGTADPEFTPQWIMSSLFIISTFTVVVSQLWYLRTKHVWHTSGSLVSSLKRFYVESIAILWTALGAFYATMPAIRPNEGVLVGVLISPFVIGIPAYCPVIMSWNVKRLMDNWYPDMDRESE